MTDDQHRLRGLRRILRRSRITEGKRVPQGPGEQHNGSNTPVVVSVRKQRGIPSSSLSSEASGSHCSTLWEEIFDSFDASTPSTELRNVARTIREQSRAPPSLSTESSAGEPELSREWHTCKQILQTAEVEKNRNNSNTAGPLKRKIKDAYNEIIMSVQKFVAVGDVILQVDPVYIGLPWADIRAILIGSTLHFLYYLDEADLRFLKVSIYD